MREENQLTYPTSDECFGRLHRAGWTIGDVAALTNTGQVWIVTGTNGENQIEARGATQGEAWHNALLQAEAVGMAGHFCRAKLRRVEM
jgi:hypothetical protein